MIEIIKRMNNFDDYQIVPLLKKSERKNEYEERVQG